MNTLLRLSALVFLLTASISCSIQKQPVAVQQQISPLPAKILTAIGYGTISREQQYRLTAAQRKLIAMRASKMDAFRTLAEQVYGVRLNGHTTVEDMAIKNDAYRAYIDAFLRGARVRSTSAIDRDTYETVVELDLTPTFFQCITGTGQCSNYPQPMPLSQTLPIEPDSTPVFNPKPVNLGCNSSDCYHYPDTRGFSHDYSSSNF